MWLGQLGNELGKLFRKRRTHLGFLVFLLAQNLMILLFRFSPAFRQMERMLDGNGYAAREFLSQLTIAMVVSIALAYILVPLFIALVGGDLVAKEAEDGTLRMVLCRPISRLRLLTLKWMAGWMFAFLLVFALGAFGLLFAGFWFPWGGMFVYVPGELFSVFAAGSGLWHYLLAHFFMAIQAGSIMSLALMFSCFNLKPAAATVLALSLVFVSLIMMNVPYFRDLQAWFLSYHLNVWQLILAQPLPWGEIRASLCLLAGLNLTCLVVGATAFHVRDIKS